MLGANLDKGIPNAARIGYTGTPIDKTERVFGDYIDKYTMRQSIDDGVTLEIVYEGRTHNAEVLISLAWTLPSGCLQRLQPSAAHGYSGLRFPRCIPELNRLLKPRPKTW